MSPSGSSPAGGGGGLGRGGGAVARGGGGGGGPRPGGGGGAPRPSRKESPADCARCRTTTCSPQRGHCARTPRSGISLSSMAKTAVHFGQSIRKGAPGDGPLYPPQ